MRMRFYPMSIGQILDNTFRLYKMNFIRFIAIVAVVKIPLFIIGLLLSDFLAAETPGGYGQEVEFVDLLPGILVGGFLTFLVWPAGLAGSICSIPLKR